MQVLTPIKSKRRTEERQGCSRNTERDKEGIGNQEIERETMPRLAVHEIQKETKAIRRNRQPRNRKGDNATFGCSRNTERDKEGIGNQEIEREAMAHLFFSLKQKLSHLNSKRMSGGIFRSPRAEENRAKEKLSTSIS